MSIKGTMDGWNGDEMFLEEDFDEKENDAYNRADDLNDELKLGEYATNNLTSTWAWYKI